MTSYGKQKCEILKRIRVQIANKLSLDYEPQNCPVLECEHGMCTRCQTETDWILNEVIDYCNENNIPLSKFFRDFDGNFMHVIQENTNITCIKELRRQTTGIIASNNNKPWKPNIHILVRKASDPEIRKMKYSSNDSEDTLTISTERKVLLGLPILNYYQADDNIYAGEYPFAEDEENGLVILKQLTVLGITFIVDLTEDNELNQYKHNLSSIVHVRFPIKDRQIPGSFESTKNLCDQIRKALDKNNIIYIHCWGGVGWTGTIVAYWYVFHGASAENAIRKLNAKWKECPKSKRRPLCPEYQHQIDYIYDFEKYMRSYCSEMFL